MAIGHAPLDGGGRDLAPDCIPPEDATTTTF
jgi:hypothetical protein